VRRHAISVSRTASSLHSINAMMDVQLQQQHPIITRYNWAVVHSVNPNTTYSSL